VLSHKGVAPPQLVRSLAVHARQSPAPLAAAGSQTWLRHVPLAPAAFIVVHGPAAFAWPQILSASHTPLRQRVDAPAVQLAPPGMTTPVATLAKQVLVPGVSQ
jgi:hypothetical protein